MGPTHEAPEAARGPTPSHTTAVSGHASGLNAYLELAARPTRHEAMLCAHLARRQPQPRVGALQQLQRRRQPRPRAERHHHPLRPPLGAVPTAINS